MVYILLAVAVIMGIAVFRLGRNAGWHSAAALLAAAVPIVLTLFFELIGFIFGGVFVGTIWKASSS